MLGKMHGQGRNRSERAPSKLDLEPNRRVLLRPEFTGSRKEMDRGPNRQIRLLSAEPNLLLKKKIVLAVKVTWIPDFKF